MRMSRHGLVRRGAGLVLPVHAGAVSSAASRTGRCSTGDGDPDSQSCDTPAWPACGGAGRGRLFPSENSESGSTKKDVRDILVYLVKMQTGLKKPRLYTIYSGSKGKQEEKTWLNRGRIAPLLITWGLWSDT